MRLNIRKRNLQWSDALAEYAERRIRTGLSRLRDGIRGVLVSLADENGPRGGRDKRCTVMVQLGAQQVVVDSRHECPYQAVDDAARRLKRAVHRRLDRARCRRRRTAPATPSGRWSHQVA